MQVQENTMLNLSCEASGLPRPSISWNVGGMVSRHISSARALTDPCPGFVAVAGHPPRPLSCSFLVGK